MRILILIILLPLLQLAQTFNITKGDVVETRKKLYYTKLMEADETGFYYFRDATNERADALLKYDLNGKLMYEKIIKYDGKMYSDYSYVDVYNKNGKILLLLKIKEAGKVSLIMREFDCKTGNELGEPKLVDQMENKNQYEYSRKFKVSFSPDNKKMLIVSEEKRDEKQQNVIGKLYEVNGYKKLWEKHAISTFSNSTVSSSNYLVNDDGVFYYLFEYLLSDYQADNAYAVGVINNSSTKTNVIMLPQTRRNYEPKLEWSGATVVFTARCWEKNPNGGKNNILGFVFGGIDPIASEMKNLTFQPFNEEFKTKLGKDFEDKIYRHLRTVLINGNYYVIKEYNYTTYFKNGSIDHGNDIMVYKYNSAFKPEWAKIIPRRTDDRCANLNYCPGVDKLYLFYYDHPESLQKFPDVNIYEAESFKKVKDPSDGVLSCTVVESNGKLSRSQIAVENDHYFSEDVEDVIVKSKKALIIPVEVEKGKQRFDLLSIKE